MTTMPPAKVSSGRFRLGVDIGGTFTDATLIDEESGSVRTAKVLSTPHDPSEGFIRAVGRIVEEASATPEEVAYIVHATTVATNAIIEGKVARTAFVTTAGFRDMLEIARQIRPSLYDLRFVKPAPLVPRHLCFGVRERLNALGQVTVPIDEEDVRAIGRQLVEEEVDAVAVCLLHSYADPAHELVVGRVLRELLPEAIISLSSEICPEPREFFRASTTVVNASISPVVTRYLERIEARLQEGGFPSSLLVMQSSGGVYRADAARERPVYMIESGPAAGVISANHIGGSLGYRDILSFDMGGTTAKVGLVQDGAPRITKDYEVGATARAGLGDGRGSGYPIRTPVIDLVEIGAGGGSIAWVDSGRVLRVGPESAGADPGPVSYSLGGIRPTVTDANLILGRLNAAYFLGGELELDVDAAREAIERDCAEPLGLTAVEAALSIVEIANASMTNALRLVSIQRGHDPRSFVLIAFGGAGPAHANRIAADNDIGTTIIPPSPGTASAMGLLATDLRHEFTRTFLGRTEDVVVDDLNSVLLELEARGMRELAREDVPPSSVEFVRIADVRYVGQSFELAMSVSGGPTSRDDLTELERQFHGEHQRAYGFNATHEPTEIVSLRVTSIGHIGTPHLRRATGSDTADAAMRGVRQVYFAETGGFVDCAVYDRKRLGVGSTVDGPAVIEEADATTVIHPGYAAMTSEHGSLIIERVGVALGGAAPKAGVVRRASEGSGRARS